jgi:hypothetical protein
MEKSSQIAWKIVPLGHVFSLKVVPLIEVLLYVKIPALPSTFGIGNFSCLSGEGNFRSSALAR